MAKGKTYAVVYYSVTVGRCVDFKCYPHKLAAVIIAALCCGWVEEREI